MEISIPPGLIPVGWSVVISPVNNTDLKKPKPSSDNCGGDQQSSDVEINSIAFNMVILDDRGRERSLQQLLERSRDGQGLKITLAYSMTDSERKNFRVNDLKFIFLEEGDKSWQVSSEDVDITGNGFGNITTTINHLTSKSPLKKSLLPHFNLTASSTRFCCAVGSRNIVWRSLLGLHVMDSFSEFPWWCFPSFSCDRRDVQEGSNLESLFLGFQTSGKVD